MELGFAEKVGIFFGLVLIILIGSTSRSSFVNAAGGEQYVFKTKWGALCTANGQFKDAGGIGVDALGHIYVVDRSNDRIEKFDSNGTFITMWGSLGTAKGQFNHPEGITVDYSVNVYVVDHGNSRIEKFDSNGTFITAWGSLGTSNGQFNEVTDVTSLAGYLYVSDYGKNNVQVFALGTSPHPIN